MERGPHAQCGMSSNEKGSEPLEKTYDDLCYDHEILLAEKASLQTQVKTMEDKLQARDDSAREVEVLKVQLAGVQGDVIDLENELKARDESNKNLDRDLAKTRSELARALDGKAHCEQQVAEATEQMNRVREDYFVAVAEAEKEIRGEVSHHESEESRIFGTYQESFNNVVEHRALLLQEASSMNSNIINLKDTVTKLEIMVQDRDVELEERDAEIEKRDQQVSDLQAEMKTRGEDIDDLKASVRQLLEGSRGNKHPRDDEDERTALPNISNGNGAINGFSLAAYDASGSIVSIDTVNAEAKRALIVEVLSWNARFHNIMNRLTGRNDTRASNKCLHRRLHNKSSDSVWTFNNPRKFACKTCTNTVQVCCVYNETTQQVVMLPLADEVRDPNATVSDTEYFLHGTKNEATKHKNAYTTIPGLARPSTDAVEKAMAACH